MTMVKIDMGGVKALSAKMDAMIEAGFPALTQALADSVELVQRRWQGWALGYAADGMSTKLKHPSGKYARSIIKQRENPLHWIVQSDVEWAPYLEYGTNEADLKKTHPYGAKSRVAKDGSTYLIVPFQFGTPGHNTTFRLVMPKSVYNIVGKFERMLITGRTFSPNARGERVGRAVYDAGYGRYKGDETITSETGKEVSMSGMVRANKENHSVYLTFRIISSKTKKGWIKPKMPAHHAAENIGKANEKEVAEIIAAGAAADIG